MKLQRVRDAWGTPEFEAVLKREVAAMPVEDLPLQQGLVYGSTALDQERTVMVISVSESAGHILAKLGVFYSSILGGCSCVDDPTPVEASEEYCEVLLKIDKTTAEASASLVEETEVG